MFPVSARQARCQARTREDAAELWEQSGFDAVEEYLLRTLDQEERIRLKLLNPLNVGLRLAGAVQGSGVRAAQAPVPGRRGPPEHRRAARALPPGDAARLRAPAGQAGPAAGRDGAPGPALLRGDHPARPDQARCWTARASSAPSSGRSSGDTPQQLEAEVGRLIDWIVERNLKVWQDVSQFVDRRRLSLHQEGMLGEVPTTLQLQPAGAAGVGRPGLARGDRRATTGSGSRAPSPTRCRAPSPPPRWPRPGPSGWDPGGDGGHRRRGRCHRHPARHRAGGGRVLRHPPEAAAGPAGLRAGGSTSSGPGSGTGSPARFTTR